MPLHKNVNDMIPQLFVIIFSNVTDLHQYDTRHANLILVTSLTSHWFKRRYQHCSPRILNVIFSSKNPNISIGLFKIAPCKLFLERKCDVINLYNLHALPTNNVPERQKNKAQLLFCSLMIIFRYRYQGEHMLSHMLFNMPNHKPPWNEMIYHFIQYCRFDRRHIATLNNFKAYNPWCETH